MSVDFTATVNGKSYGFDFEDQRIDVDATIDNMLVEDLYTAIKEAHSSQEGIPYCRIATGGGTDTLGTGIATFLTVTLLESWEVNTLKSSGKFEVSGGNLIRSDQADPFRDNASITYIAFLSQAGIATQIETGVSGLTASESTQLAKIDSVDSNVDGVKAKTDQLNFTGTDVQSTASNMRGTDGANTVAPDNATITSIDGKVDIVDANVDSAIVNQGVVNTGVQKASKLIPHTTDL